MIYVKVQGANPIVFQTKESAEAATKDMRVIEMREATPAEIELCEVAK